MIQVDFSQNDDTFALRVVVVDTRKELQQTVQGMAWVLGQKNMYKADKKVTGATLKVFGHTVVLLSKEDLTWEVLSHEVTHAVKSNCEDEEELATNVGLLTTAIAKELKTHGYKVTLR